MALFDCCPSEPFGGGYAGDVPEPVQLLEAFARVHGLLDVAPRDDTAHLIALLEADGDSDLVLTPLGGAAYARTADQFNVIWALNSRLQRFIYQRTGDEGNVVVGGYRAESLFEHTFHIFGI
jgi:hypothetical protein